MTRALHTYPATATAPAPALAPNFPHSASDLADLFHLAVSGWLPASAASGLEALFDRMEAGR